MKVLPPSLFNEPAVARAFRDEAVLLSTPRSRSLPQILDAGHLDLVGFQVPFFATATPRGEPLSELLARGGLDTHFLRCMLLELLEALAALHTPTTGAPPIVHADLRESGILVAREPFSLLLADYDVCVTAEAAERWPAAWRARLRRLSSPAARRAASTCAFVPRDELSPEVDLHLLHALLAPHLPSIAVAAGSDGEHEYLLGFLRSLGPDAVVAGGSPRLRYPSAAEALAALRRGLSADDATCRAFKPSGYLRVAHGALDFIDSSVRNIIDAPEFQRLRDLSQLGLAKLVYPGACHTRFEHSLSAFRFSLAYLKSLLRGSGDHAFRQDVSDADLAFCALAALLHDVGHLPFRHYLGPSSNAPSQKAGALHLLTSSSLGDRVAEVLGELGASLTDFLRFFSYSFDPEPREDIPPHWYALARIINGPIDVDKLSHLTLDGLHAGLPHATSVDVDALTRSLVAVRVDGHFDLALEEQARIPAELLAVARYAMYESVYWHRTVRAFSTMVRRAFDIAFLNVDRQAILERAVRMGDDVFLQWLAQELNHRSPQSRWLVEDVVSRRPLHRALSLRQGRKDGQGGADDVDVEGRLYQRLLAASRDPSGAAMARAEIAFRTALSEVSSPSAEPTVVLVDFPGQDAAVAGDIRLLHRPSCALIGPGPLWTAIQQNFKEWVSKARVFAKPGLELSCAQRRVIINRSLDLLS